MVYEKILKSCRKNNFCPFCHEDKKFILAENKFAYITPARAPYVKDHLLVIPKKHALNLAKLKGKEKKAIFDLIMKGIKILEKKYPAVEMGYKEGDLLSARKTIPHLHFHLVPKRKRNKFSNVKRNFLDEKQLIKEVEKIKNF